MSIDRWPEVEDVVREDVLQVGEHGPIYRLRPPHTVTALRASLSASLDQQVPLRCRIKHKWRIVGEVYIDPEDPMGTTLSMIWMGVSGTLAHCERCGAVATRGAP